MTAPSVVQIMMTMSGILYFIWTEQGDKAKIEVTCFRIITTCFLPEFIHNHFLEDHFGEICQRFSEEQPWLFSPARPFWYCTKGYRLWSICWWCNSDYCFDWHYFYIAESCWGSLLRVFDFTNHCLKRAIAYCTVCDSSVCETYSICILDQVTLLPTSK